jgi:hypothetical protein
MNNSQRLSATGKSLVRKRGLKTGLHLVVGLVVLEPHAAAYGSGRPNGGGQVSIRNKEADRGVMHAAYAWWICRDGPDASEQNLRRMEKTESRPQDSEATNEVITR